MRLEQRGEDHLKRNRIGSIIGVMLCVVLLPIAAVNVTMAVKSYLQPEKVAMIFGIGPLIVETGSMSPAFEANDLLLVKETDAEALQAGDIIAFYDYKGTVVTHRVIGFDTDGAGARLYITKGDFNNVEDRDPVPASNVVGIVAKVYPRGGEKLMLLKQPWVTAVLIGVPVGLWLGVSALAKKLSARKKGKEAEPGTDEPHRQPQE